MDYKIVPNFLPKSIFDSFTNFFFEKPLFSYVYLNRVGTPNDESGGFFFTQNLYEGTNITNTTPHFFYVSTPLLYHANITTPIRVKANLFVKQPHHIFTEPHYDYNEPHKVLLYSLNTNNGFTVLDPEDKNIKIPSIANQALFFDGSIKHQAVTQTDENVRINININYIN